MRRDTQRRSEGVLVSVLHLGLGFVLVFLSHLLVGAALGSGAWFGDSSLLAQAMGLWAGCLGASQLVYLLPLFLVCWRVRRALAAGVALGAALVAALQLSLYVLVSFGLILALQPPGEHLGDYTVSYDEQRVVKVGEEVLHPQPEGTPADPLRRYEGTPILESDLCGPDKLICPGPESWDLLSLMALDEGGTRFFFEGPAISAGRSVDGTLHDGSITLQLEYPPDLCSAGDPASIEGHLSADGSSFRGQIRHRWPAGCTIAGVPLQDTLTIERSFVARRTGPAP